MAPLVFKTSGAGAPRPVGSIPAASAMNQRRFGTTGMLVSELGLGTMTFGRESDEAQSRAVLDRYLDAGGNLIDTADVYAAGRSEEILGRALGTRRDRVVLATKFRMTVGADPNERGASRRHLRASLEASLRRLQTDRIDLYQVHLWDPFTPLDETLSTLDDAVRDGKVLYVGASNFTGWQIAQALGRSLLNRWEPFVSVQPQYSLAERGAEREVIPAAKAFGLAVVPWSPLAGGLLTGKYAPGVAPPGATRLAGTTAGGVRARSWFDAGSKDAIVHAVREVAAAVDRSPAQVALNWVLNRPGVTAPIVGARTPEQLDADLSATGWHLDDEHRRRLDDASAIERGYPYDFIDEVLAR